LERFFDRWAKNAEKRHGQRTFTGTPSIIGGRLTQVNVTKAKEAKEAKACFYLPLGLA